MSTDLHVIRYGSIIEKPEKYIERSSLLCQQARNQPSQRSFIIEGLRIVAILILRIEQIAFTITPMKGTGKKDGNVGYTNKSGKMHMALFQRATMFITKIITRLTIPLTTWNVFLKAIIISIMDRSQVVKRNWHIWKKYALLLLPGISQKKDVPGIKHWAVMPGNMQRLERLSVSIVVQTFLILILAHNRNSVLMLANLLLVGKAVLIMSSALVSNVGKPFQRTSTARLASVQQSAWPVIASGHAENKKSNEWFTPAKYINAARSVMGGIDLDPASCELANQTVRAERYYSKENDGLTKPWYGRVWLNPPYGRTEDMQGSNIGLFIFKLLHEYEKSNVSQAIACVTSQCDAKWFQPLWKHPLCFTDHRVHFITTCPTPKYPTRSHILGTVFVYLGPHEQKFIDTFSQFGRIAKAIDTPRQTVVPLSLWEEAQ